LKYSYPVNTDFVPGGQAFQPVRSFWQDWSKHLLGITFACLVFLLAFGILPGITAQPVFVILLIALGASAIGIACKYLKYCKTAEALVLRAAEINAPPKEHSPENCVLQDNEASFREVFDQAFGMALSAPDGRWLNVNRSFCETLGYLEAELLGSSFQDIVHGEELGSVLMHINKVLSGNVNTYQGEHRFIDRWGRTVWVLLSTSVIRGAQTEPAQLVFQIQNISDRKRAEERLVHDVFHDALTGLPNRALFMDRLKLAAQRARRRKDQLFAVLFIDLDRFKVVNDSFGHQVGDQLLIGIARRLETFVRSTDTIARLGGDEFTVLLEDVKDQSEAVRIVGRIQKGLSQPFTLGGHELCSTASVGVALSTTGYDKVDDILRDADTAMYRAKSLGKARHEVFDKETHAQAVNLLRLERDLEGVTNRGELFLQYQPIVALDTGRLQGFEALVRWQHPKYGLISPLDFVPIAEEMGFISTIGQWVLTEACSQLRQWQEELHFDQSLFMSVNLSSKQLKQPNLIDQLLQNVNQTGLDPRCLKLEITESVVMEDIETAIRQLRQMRAIGIGLSIDDFGAGYSSLSYLNRLPINTLKIDRSFVTGITTNTENRNIIETIMTLAQNLGMDVIAEGIETIEQLILLRDLKCRAGQGFLFSKPLDAKAASALTTTKPLWGEALNCSAQTYADDCVELLTGSYQM
jgi:diguanylate cyclase (GGDEF)-like protein/PAS domain S-box-containing protein